MQDGSGQEVQLPAQCENSKEENGDNSKVVVTLK